jgi:hypothetical protein
MATVYFGSVVNPTGHLHGLPVMIVDEDTGAVVDGHHGPPAASCAHRAHLHLSWHATVE